MIHPSPEVEPATSERQKRDTSAEKNTFSPLERPSEEAWSPSTWAFALASLVDAALSSSRHLLFPSSLGHHSKPNYSAALQAFGIRLLLIPFPGSRYTPFILLVHYLKALATSTATSSIRYWGARGMRMVTAFAIRNPLKFRRRLTSFLAVLRQVKIVAPIIGVFNKLKRNVNNLLKKMKQARAAAKAEKQRRNNFLLLSREEKEEFAAELMQAAVRRFRARKEMLQKLKEKINREQKAAMKLQTRYRAARSAKNTGKAGAGGTNASGYSFPGAEAGRGSTNKGHVQAGPIAKARARMIGARLAADPHRTSAPSSNGISSSSSSGANSPHQDVAHWLLVRPDTQFAFWWTVLAVSAIVVEVAQVVLSPWLSQGKLKKMPVESLVKALLLGGGAEGGPAATTTSASAGAAAAGTKTVPALWRALTSKLPGKRRRLAETTTATEVCSSFPVSFSCLQSRYVRLWAMAVHLTAISLDAAVSMVVFLDVFVAFFIGELADATLVLEPKPFFTRWVLPGVGLQVLVNPTMATVKRVLGLGLDAANRVGPLRVMRWGLALAPLGSWAAEWALVLWAEFTRRQNTRKVNRVRMRLAHLEEAHRRSP